MGIAKTKYYKIWPAIILAMVICLACAVITGCQSEDDTTNNLNIDLSLPSDELQLQHLMSSTNISGGNIVITDGNSIYFSSIDNDFIRTDKNGDNPEIIISQLASWPLIADDQIFYTMGGNNGQLSKMEMDGSSHVRIGSNTLSNLIFHDDMIYAIEEPDKTLISVKTDGTGREQLTEYPVTCFILRGDSLYIAGKTAQQGLIRYNIIDDEETQLAKTAAGNLQADNEYLYYVDLQQQYSLYAISLQDFVDYRSNDEDQSTDDEDANSNDQETKDVNDSTEVLETSLILNYSLDRQFAILDSYLFYIDSSSQNQLFKLKLDQDNTVNTGDAELAVDDAVGTFSLLDPYIYYRRADVNRLYRTDPDTPRPIRVN